MVLLITDKHKIDPSLEQSKIDVCYLNLFKNKKVTNVFIIGHHFGSLETDKNHEEFIEKEIDEIFQMKVI